MATLEEKAFNAVQQGNLEALQSLAREEASREGNLLNAVGQNRRPLLNFAALFGHERIIRWLLSDEGGRALGFTNVLGRNFNGWVALHDAAECGHLACCQAIVEGCKVENGEREQMLNAVTNQGCTVLDLAACKRRESIVRWLLSNAEGGGRALGLKSETVTALRNDSKCILHFIAAGEPSALIEALLSGCSAGERIKLFLVVDRLGWTPFHYAVRYQNAEAIQQLLRWEEAKMIVDARDHRGMTALHRMACNGGLDAASRLEWAPNTPFWRPPPIEDVVRALLGLNPAATRARAAFVDVNARLKISEELKQAVPVEKRPKAIGM